jgi:hypothetical protein
MVDTGTHIMRVALRADPGVYRDIEIQSSKSLYALADAIIGAFDFDLDHCFGFYSGRSERSFMEAQPKYELFADIGEETDAGSVERTTIAEAFPTAGRRMTFLFDYGDRWLFDVKTTALGKSKPKTRYPKTLARSGPSPEQYPDEEEDD